MCVCGSVYIYIIYTACLCLMKPVMNTEWHFKLCLLLIKCYYSAKVYFTATTIVSDFYKLYRPDGTHTL